MKNKTDRIINRNKAAAKHKEAKKGALSGIILTEEENEMCNGLSSSLKSFYTAGGRGGRRAYIKHYREFTIKYRQ